MLNFLRRLTGQNPEKQPSPRPRTAKARTGAEGEEAAASYLSRLGWNILDRNWRSRQLELDIVAEEKGTLVFVEVKLRKTSDFAQALEHVDVPKQNRIRTTAEMFLSQFETDLQPRFDVIEIYAPQGVQTKDPVINHLEDAF